MRIVCGFDVDAGRTARRRHAGSPSRTRSFADRLGWREIVTTGSGVTLARRRPATLRTTSTSHRLTAYPTNLLTQALDDAAVDASWRRPVARRWPPFDIPDATPLDGAAPVAAVAGPSAAPAIPWRRPRAAVGGPCGGRRVRAGRRERRRAAVDLPRRPTCRRSSCSSRS